MPVDLAGLFSAAVECTLCALAGEPILVPPSERTRDIESELPDIKTFVTSITQRSRVTLAVLVTANIFIRRFHCKYPNSPAHAAHRVFLTALMVANKMVEDGSHSNSMWARLSNLFSLADLNRMELEFVSMSDFSFSVSHEEFESHLAALSNFAPARASAGSPIDKRQQVLRSFSPSAHSNMSSSPPNPSYASHEDRSPCHVPSAPPPLCNSVAVSATLCEEIPSNRASPVRFQPASASLGFSVPRLHRSLAQDFCDAADSDRVSPASHSAGSCSSSSEEQPAPPHHQQPQHSGAFHSTQPRSSFIPIPARPTPPAPTVQPLFVSYVPYGGGERDGAMRSRKRPASPLLGAASDDFCTPPNKRRRADPDACFAGSIYGELLSGAGCDPVPSSREPSRVAAGTLLKQQLLLHQYILALDQSINCVASTCTPAHPPWLMAAA